MDERLLVGGRLRVELSCCSWSSLLLLLLLNWSWSSLLLVLLHWNLLLVLLGWSWSCLLLILLGWLLELLSFKISWALLELLLLLLLILLELRLLELLWLEGLRKDLRLLIRLLYRVDLMPLVLPIRLLVVSVRPVLIVLTCCRCCKQGGD